MKTKRVLSLALSILMIMTVLPLSSFVTIDANAETVEVKSSNSINVGDCITLGTYNGEPIVWRCVLIDENGPLMLSEEVLCNKEYDAAGESSTYHTDGWGYIRKSYGSNCWQDSNIRQWLNSDEISVSWTHCPPSYKDEAGFMTNFTSSEKSMIKTVNRIINVNIWESKRSGYCDGGNTDDTGAAALTSSSFDPKYYYYKIIEDTMFLISASQYNAIYRTNSNYLKSDSSYYTSCIDGNNYACYEWLVGIGANSAATNGGCTAYQSNGIRPAFYLNEEQYGGTSSNNNTIQIGADRLSFGEDITGYVGDVVNSLVVYKSATGDTTLLEITSSNTDVVEIDTIQHGVGDYITGQNESQATIPLNLKAEGASTITITSPEGVSASVNVTVTKAPEVKRSIAVFSTEKSLSVNTGESMWLAFGIMDEETGLVEENWKKMAITVSDPTIISLSDYKETEYGYSLEVIGKKEGATNVTITDTETGINTIIVISVYDSFVKTYSYEIDNIKTFYPNNKHENHIATNIYNLNGMYVNNYKTIKNSDGGYTVTFDVYNSRYYYGAVDIYDENGMWLGFEEIKKYSDIDSVWDTGVQAFFLITDAINKLNPNKESNLLTYQQASFSMKTEIKISVPKNGYFTISNNISESPGTYVVNTLEILFDASFTVLEATTSGINKVSAFDDILKETKKNFAQRLIDARNEGLKNEVKRKAQKVMLNSMKSKIKSVTKSCAKKDIVDQISVMSTASTELVDLLESSLFAEFKINWKSIFENTFGLGEAYFTKFSGPAGMALQGCFAITKGTNKLMMVSQLAWSSNNPYVTIYSDIEEGYINPYGVIVNTAGNIDTEAVLQVFRVSNNDAVDIILNSSNPLEKHELYNICFVKDDKLVQPSGKVTVHIPIPEGMNSNTCKVYRQESDGAWTILDAHIESNYLVFETDHFSLYSVVGDMDNLSIHSLPNKVVYTDGDILDTTGLVLNLNGELITAGFICDPTVLSGVGNKNITVQYGSATANFEVRVKALGSYMVSGNIESFGDQEGNISLCLIDASGVVEELLTSSGNYAFENVAAGTYTLEISKAGHITRTYEITVGEENIVQDVELYLLGDVNADGDIDADDYILLKRVFFGMAKLENQTNPETVLARSDIHGDDGKITADDYILLKRVYFGMAKLG